MTDNRGNNVLHILTKMDDSSVVFNCMKLIMKRTCINPMSTNNDGKKPLDFIESKDDTRIKFLEDLEETGGVLKGNKKKKKKKKNDDIEAVGSKKEISASNEGMCILHNFAIKM